MACACGSGNGADDKELGGLVYKAKVERKPVDVSKALQEPGEFARAMMLSQSYVADKLGAHSVQSTSSVAVTVDGSEVFSLEDQTDLTFDDEGGFHARLHNSHDYGREVYFVEGVLFLRPRYGKFHRRGPADPDEPTRIKSEMFGGLAANWELVAPAAMLTGGNVGQVQGRSARSVTMALSSEPRERPEELHDRSKWRETVTVKSLTGTARLDDETGVPLASEFAATLTYVKDDKRHQMSIAFKHMIEKIGGVDRVVAPPAEQTVVATKLSSEVDDRRALLKGIARPSPTVDAPTHRSLTRRRRRAKKRPKDSP